MKIYQFLGELVYKQPKLIEVRKEGRGLGVTACGPKPSGRGPGFHRPKESEYDPGRHGLHRSTEDIQPGKAEDGKPRPNRTESHRVLRATRPQNVVHVILHDCRRVGYLRQKSLDYAGVLRGAIHVY